MATVHAVILAAGEGSRMKSELPKVLHNICGRSMIAYAIDLAASVGARQPVIVLGHGAEQVKPVLPKEAKVIIQSKQHGTGDAVLSAKRAIGSQGDVLILYGDTPLLRRGTVQRLIEQHVKTGATCSLLTAHLADPSGYGRIVRNELNAITGVVEESEAGAAQRTIREINVGPLVCKAAALLEALETVKPSGSKREIFLTHIISHIARQENAKVHAVRVEETAEALGVNSRSDLARAIGVIRQRIVDAHLNNGVTIEETASTYIEHGVAIGADTVIRPYTVIHSGVTIGKRCTIGPFTRLRNGVAVADDSRIGSFAELVRTKVGRRVRISHVSYLGDAIVEDDVNIGAGTITANYDGREKHTTHIGKGAFIGSDTVLIAPVKIGAGAVTGAGSVVTKAHDVPNRGVVVGVPARAFVRDGKAGGPARPIDGRKAPTNGAAARAAAERPSAKPAAGRTARKPARTRPAAKARVKLKTRKRTRPTRRARVVRRPAARRARATRVTQRSRR